MSKWFHVRIVVEKPKVSVYVNDKEPSLVVEELMIQKRPIRWPSPPAFPRPAAPVGDGRGDKR